MGRDAEMHIYGPKGIKEAILLLLKLGKSYTNFPLYFHELDQKVPQLIFEDDKLSVETIPLIHRVYTNGFLFKEKPEERKLNVDAARDANIKLLLILHHQNPMLFVATPFLILQWFHKLLILQFSITNPHS